MSNKILIASFILVGMAGLLIGVLGGYIWGGWYEWEKGYRFAVTQSCAGDAETVRSKDDALNVVGTLSPEKEAFLRRR
ncbi:MAG: hypothetical protein ABSA46_12860 [Thermodesulfovibrionales bacterium]|jgi:hypothetical protein